VPAAILFDLSVGDSDAYPDEDAGQAACGAAREGDIATGGVGAGTGATVGKLLGIGRASRGGLGAASVSLPGGARVAALAAVNSFGDVVDPETGRPLAGARGEKDFLLSTRALCRDDLPDRTLPGANTTLVCVATDVAFEQGALKRVAIEAHDGIARAVRPAHTVVDGDVVFALAPAGGAPSLLARLRVGTAAAEAVARAIVNAVES
jgi:L-aminopeptidase/D-esterase-like protein